MQMKSHGMVLNLTASVDQSSYLKLLMPSDNSSWKRKDCVKCSTAAQRLRLWLFLTRKKKFIHK